MLFPSRHNYRKSETKTNSKPPAPNTETNTNPDKLKPQMGHESSNLKRKGINLSIEISRYSQSPFTVKLC